MISNEVIITLKKKFADLNPIVFARSVELANNPGELWDILDDCPKDLPIVWCYEKRRWIKVDIKKHIGKIDVEG